MNTRHRYTIINVADAIEAGILQPEYERPSFRDALFDCEPAEPRLVWMEPLDISGALHADMGALVAELNALDGSLRELRAVNAADRRGRVA